MGLFKKKTREPLTVGAAIGGLNEDGSAEVKQQYHAAVTPEAIAALAPITWVLATAVSRHEQSIRAAQEWVELCASYDGTDDLNSQVNPAGVSAVEPDDEMGGSVGAFGRFALLPSSDLVGTWVPFGNFQHDDHAVRVLGVLVEAAAWLGQDREVWHALASLAATNIDYGRSEILATLPQMLLDYGAQQVSIEDSYPKGPFGQ